MHYYSNVAGGCKEGYSLCYNRLSKAERWWGQDLATYIYMAITFAAVAITAYLLTPRIERWARARQLLQLPGEERRVHTVPTPRIGGIAIFVAVMLGFALTFLLPIGRENNPQGAVAGVQESWRVALMMVGATLVFAIALWDDIRSLPALPRLLVQFGAAAIVILPRLLVKNDESSYGILIGDFNLPHQLAAPASKLLGLSLKSPISDTVVISANALWLAMLLTFFWVVGMTNLMNFIDGLDGLAAGVTLISSLVLFLRTFALGQNTIAFLPLVLAAAMVGFLPFNFNPARIFMGDGGAMFLGYCLAVISFIGGAKLATALLVLGVPMLDATWLAIYRISRKRSPLSADRLHLHQRLLDMGFSQRQVVFFFYAVSAVFGSLGLLLDDRLLKFVALLVMSVLLVALLIYISRREFDRRRSAS